MSTKKFTKRTRSALLASAGINKVFELCKEMKPGHQWSMAGTRIRGRCTFDGHNDTSPSMDIVFDGGRVFQKCLGCGQYESDGLRIVAMITDEASIMRNLEEVFIHRFKMEIPEELNEAIEQEEHSQKLKKALLSASQMTLANGLFNSGGEFAYVQDAVNTLRVRGVDMTTLHIHGIGVFPVLKHFADYGDISLISELHEYLGPKVFDVKPLAPGRYGGWIMFPYYTTPTTVGRLKLRNPLDKTQETWLGRSTKEARGFFGLQLSALYAGADLDQYKRAHLVEGEFDQLSLAQAQVAHNANDHFVVLGASGAGSSHVEVLADSGINHIIAIGDNDAGGDAFVKNIVRNARGPAARQISVYDWSKSGFPEKDPDEIVQAGKYVKFWDGVASLDHIIDLDEWAATSAKREVDAIPHARTTQKIDVINTYGNMIEDEVVRDLFVARASASMNIDKFLLSKHVVRNDTERSFRLNIERALGQHIEAVALTGTHDVLFYSKADREMFEVSMKRTREAELVLQSRVFHMKTFEFIAANVGIPDWVSVAENKKGVVSDVPEHLQAAEVTRQVDWALQNFVSTAAPQANFNIRHQGIHWADAGNDIDDKRMLAAGEPEQRVYCVNGRDLFLGRRTDGDSADYSLMDSPVHGNYLLWGKRGQHWSKAAHSVDAIMSTPVYDQVQAYEMIYDMIYSGWQFRDHELSCRYLAANILTISAGMVFDYLPYTFLTAPTQSGKSTMLKGLIGGEDPAHIGIIEHAVAYDDYTAAGVMQSATGSSLLHCLDEWEDPDTAQTTSKSRAVQSLLEMTRNLSAGMTRTRGTTSGVATSRYLRFPIVAAGIVPHRNLVDLNRWFTLEIDKHPGKKAPEAIILEKYSIEQIENLKQSLTILCLQNAFKLKDMESTLLRQILTEGKITPMPSTRYAKALMSTLVGLMWVGEDPFQFGKDFIAKANAYANNADLSEERRLYKAVFETNAVRLENSVVPVSVLNILAHTHTRDMLSLADVGLYHLPGSHVVVIYCGKLNAILKNNTHYRATTNTHQIFSLLKRNPEVKHDPTFFMKNPAIFQHLRAYLSHPRVDELLYINLSDLEYASAPLVSPELNQGTV